MDLPWTERTTSNALKPSLCHREEKFQKALRATVPPAQLDDHGTLSQKSAFEEGFPAVIGEGTMESPE